MGDKERSEDLFHEFLSRRESGEDVNPEEYYRKYPELEADLRKFLAKLTDKQQENRDIETASPESLQIIGDFKIIKEIGRGGMGTVYEAEQISLKRKVALKVLPSHLRFSKEAVLKFRREAEAGSRQSHPGIVAIHTVGEHEGVHFIAQELVSSGVNLNDKLEELRTTREQPSGYFREVAKLIAQIADSLNHAHKSGVIHRDIKPSNILLTEEGNPKVTDFGLAKIEDALALSRTGDFAGTPYYMSPEQAMSRRIGIDKRTDIYSLGVTLYEMLCLKRPFEGQSSHEILKKIVLSDPREPHRLNPRVPRDLSTICLKAMEKLPEKRYHNMIEFYEDLNRFLSGDVILAKSAGLKRRIWKKVKRNPVVSALISLLFILILFAIIFIPQWIARAKFLAEIESNSKIEFQKKTHQMEMADRYKEIIRLSDISLLTDLEEEAESIWPAQPKNISIIQSWINRAEELIDRYDTHRLTLESLRENAIPAAVTEEADHRIWNFEDTETQWQHDTLASLILGIELLTDEDNGLLSSMKQRLDLATTIEKRTIYDYEDAWSKAIASISNEDESPQYKGLVIKPMLGFVPIGRDPQSGLWEFVHLQTGDTPKRDQNDKLVFTDKAGIILVLIPAGTFNMGASRPSNTIHRGTPNNDPNAAPDESPIHSVSIRPYLISKFEMTQGQWLRAFDFNPSMYGPECTNDVKAYNLLHPVEQISWEDCNKYLWRIELRMPSEAEWEYAARAGTSTIWFTGDDKKNLDGYANMLDLSYDRIGVPGWIVEDWLDDGYVRHAPVGSYLPNLFGLHDVHGNVWEWCQDSYHENYIGAPDDGSAWLSNDMRFKICRGGCYLFYSKICRSAIRSGTSKSRIASDIGVRPAGSIKLR